MGAGLACSTTCGRSPEDLDEVLTDSRLLDAGQKKAELAPYNMMDGKDDGEPGMSPVTCSTDLSASPSNQEEAEEEDEGAVDVGKGEEAMLVFEESFNEVLGLCRKGRVFDAMTALKNLEQDVQERSPAKRLDGGQALRNFVQRLQEDPLLKTLREVHGRMTSVLSILGPSALPGGAGDKRWVSVNITDPNIHPEFHGDIRIRFAEGAERDPHGPSTQIITYGSLTAYPMDLEEFVSVYRETDLYEKEWVADCEQCEGKVGGPEKLYSAYSRFINSSPLMPTRLEILTVREFAVCTKSPVPNRGPGVVVVDMSPPSDAKTFAGWPMPDPVKRITRMSGVGLILYFTPRKDKPGFCDVFAFAKAAAPLPQWLVPLSLLKRFFANHFVSLFRAIKNFIKDDWEKLGYKDRISGKPDLYESISDIKRMLSQAS
mmetsp:Transcript_171236/g.549014  ORF Transcript_171236/g.549014 Transcript_171236/m.549014 type:complete len:430 (-) Transcript_171236:65-1354(-)